MKQTIQQQYPWFPWVVPALLAIIVLTSLAILCRLPRGPPEQPEQFTYEYITLNDKNYIASAEVVEYLCTDEVYVYTHTHNWLYRTAPWFYASTWQDGTIPHSTGHCLLKTKQP